MLEVPNFGHITTYVTWFDSPEKVLSVTSWTEIKMSQPLFQNTFILRRPRVVNVPDIIQIVTMITKATSEDSKFKTIKELCIKVQSILVFLDITKLLISHEKTLMSAEPKGCVKWFIYFLNHVEVRYNYAIAHHFRICVTNVRYGKTTSSGKTFKPSCITDCYKRISISAVIINCCNKIQHYFSCFQPGTNSSTEVKSLLNDNVKILMKRLLGIS